MLGFTSGHDKVYVIGHALVNYSNVIIDSKFRTQLTDSVCHARSIT